MTPEKDHPLPDKADKALAGPPDVKPPHYEQAVRHTDKKTLNYLGVRLLYRTQWFRLVLAAVSGLLLMISFPPLSYGLFGWIALVPLLIAIYTAPTQRVAGLCGIIAGAVFYSISLSFLFDVFDWLGLIIANILSIYLALFSVSVWMVASKIGLRRSFILIPFFWTGIELFRSENYQLKFSWLSLGYSQSPYLTLIQVCDLVGVYGLTFLIVTVNALLAWFLLKYIRTLKWRWSHPIMATLILLALVAYGLTREPYQPKHLRSSQLKGVPVVAVQEWVDSVDRYVKTTSEMVNGQEETLVAWPERSFRDFLSNPDKRGVIETLVREKKLYLVFGTIEPTDDPMRFNNYAVLMGPDGNIIGKYAKRVPVPFLEAVVRPGNEWGAFDTGFGRIGIFICYESGFTRIARWLVVSHGVELFVAPTLEQAGWAGLSHKIHATIAPFRAVETRRAIIRPAALGISQIIHPSGRVEGKLGYLASGAIRSQVPRSDKLTWYVQYGHFLPKFCLWVYSGFILLWVLLSLTNYFKEE